MITLIITFIFIAASVFHEANYPVSHIAQGVVALLLMNLIFVFALNLLFKVTQKYLPSDVNGNQLRTKIGLKFFMAIPALYLAQCLLERNSNWL